MWSIKELKQTGKIDMKKSYWKTVLVSLIFTICAGAGSSSSFRSGSDEETKSQIDSAISGIDPSIIFAVIAIVIGAILLAVIIGALVSIFVLNPLMIGCKRYFYDNHESSTADLNSLSFGFSNGNYKNVVKIMFLMGIKVFLWSLLLIIPGIIKTYEYRMIPNILAENPQMDSKAAFARSKELMMGSKMKAFLLDLSFIGWHLLTAITFGIVGVFYSLPYIYSTEMALYFKLKEIKNGPSVNPYL